jgi:ketosteroid isomerase-like protein
VSQENVEIVARAIDGFNQRDVEALADLVTPDFELFPAVIGVVEGGSYRGRDGLATYFDTLSDAWGEMRIVPDELRDLGDRVLVLGRIEGHGRGSGVPVHAPQGIIFDVRGGKMSRIRTYLDHGEALRAAGLSEASGQADA